MPEASDQEIIERWCDEPGPLLPVLHAFHDATHGTESAVDRSYQHVALFRVALTENDNRLTLGVDQISGTLLDPFLVEYSFNHFKRTSQATNCAAYFTSQHW